MSRGRHLWDRAKKAARHSVGVLVFCAMVLGLNGCMLGPDYELPESAVNSDWVEAESENIKTTKEDAVEWWKTFNDPLLDALIEEAYQENLTLQMAGVMVMQAVAQRGIAFGEIFPQTQNLNGAYSRDKFSENPTPPNRYQSTWGLGFDTTWELDIWGKFRRGIESADADLEASLATYDNVMVMLISEVAATYTQIRTLQVRIKIAAENVKIQEESLTLAESRFKNGATSELDVAQAKSALNETRSSVPVLQTQLSQSIYRLNLLFSKPPANLLKRLGEAAVIPFASKEVAIGIPADLLRRRPDIRLAERQAAAQSALVGVAETQLYPSFFLSGSLGLQSDTASDLFSINSWTGSLMPGFSWPILNYGRLKNNVRVQDAAFQEAILNYQNTVLVATNEVESSLAGFLGTQKQVKYLKASTQSAKRSLTLSMIRYREGSSTFTRVLNSQTQLRRVQESLANAKGQVALNLISTYKALGGGWEIRIGKSILPSEIKATMEERTDWGDMLESTPPPDKDEAERGETVVPSVKETLSSSK